MSKTKENLHAEQKMRELEQDQYAQAMSSLEDTQEYLDNINLQTMAKGRFDDVYYNHDCKKEDGCPVCAEFYRRNQK